jgi:hypothetical protein
MCINKSISYVSNKFKYKSDPDGFLDYWYVMKEKEGVLNGDCEDYSLTVFWELSNRNIFKFLFHLLVSHKYELYLVDSSSGPHIVGCYKDIWFDNWTLKGLPKDEFFKITKHTNTKRIMFFNSIAPLINGYIYRLTKLK